MGELHQAAKPLSSQNLPATLFPPFQTLGPFVSQHLSPRSAPPTYTRIPDSLLTNKVLPLYLSLSLTLRYMKTYFCKCLAPKKHDGCGINATINYTGRPSNKTCRARARGLSCPSISKPEPRLPMHFSAEKDVQSEDFTGSSAACTFRIEGAQEPHCNLIVSLVTL